MIVFYDRENINNQKYSLFNAVKKTAGGFNYNKSIVLAGNSNKLDEYLTPLN